MSPTNQASTLSKEERSAASAGAQAAGKAFEKARDLDLLTLQQRGFVAVWWPNNPGWARRGPKWIPVEASGADRAGTLRNAISFALEFKSTGRDKKGRPAPFNRQRISFKQEAHLDGTARVRAVALLSLEWRLETENVVATIPWVRVPWNGRKVLHLDDVAQFVHPVAQWQDVFMSYCEEMTRWVGR